MRAATQRYQTRSETDRMTTTSRPPAGLAAAGKGLWRRVHESAELRHDEVRILLDACRTADEVDAMTKALAGESLVVTGSRGQSRAHPLIAEIRSHRLLLARLLGQLALPDDEGTDAAARRTALTSRQARAAAQARWAR